jgi:hypothetical protein
MNRTLMLADHSSILNARSGGRWTARQQKRHCIRSTAIKRQLLYSAVAASMTGQMKFLRALERQTIRDD